MAESTTQSEKHCSTCGRLRPLTEFRRVCAADDERRRSVCRSCRNDQDRERGARSTQKQLRSSLTRLAAEENAGRLATIATAMVESLGGIQNVAQTLPKVMQQGSPATRQRAISAVLNLVKAVNAAEQAAEEERRKEAIRQQRAQADRIGRMSHEERNRELAAVLRHHGWTVQPPANNQAVS